MSEKKLVSFGEYLLSVERDERLKLTMLESQTAPPYELRVKEVHDADIDNWETIHYDKTRL